jgi:hypothetical protein
VLKRRGQIADGLSLLTGVLEKIQEGAATRDVVAARNLVSALEAELGEDAHAPG